MIGCLYLIRFWCLFSNQTKQCCYRYFLYLLFYCNCNCKFYLTSFLHQVVKVAVYPISMCNVRMNTFFFLGKIWEKKNPGGACQQTTPSPPITTKDTNGLEKIQSILCACAMWQWTAFFYWQNFKKSGGGMPQTPLPPSWKWYHWTGKRAEQPMSICNVRIHHFSLGKNFKKIYGGGVHVPRSPPLSLFTW